MRTQQHPVGQIVALVVLLVFLIATQVSKNSQAQEKAAKQAYFDRSWKLPDLVHVK